MLCWVNKVTEVDWGGFPNLLQPSLKPLILPDNSYIFRLAKEQHVLTPAIEPYPSEHIFVMSGQGSLFFYLLGVDE